VTRLARIATVAALAAALFAVGALGLFLGSRAEPPPELAPVPQAGAFLSPGGEGTLGGSIVSLQERVRQVPADWHASASLGLAYVQQARITADPSYYPKAEGVLERSLEVRPDGNAAAFLGFAALSAARHDFHAALRYGERARDLNPYDANVHGVVGDALLELGRYDEAIESFQTMVDTLPGVGSFARVSYARELHGDLAGAISAMRQARSFAGTPDATAWTSYQLGELYLGVGRMDAAAEAFRLGVGADPTSVASFTGLAMVAWARGDLDRAIGEMSDVVRRFPAPEYVIALGDLYQRAGNDEAAAQQYQLAQAESDLFAAAGVNMDLELALFEANHGDPAEALAAAEAEWARRRSIQVADALAWALHANGRDGEASRYARRALSLGTREGLYLYHAGIIELGRGNRDAARSLLRRALDVDPWFSILGVPEARRVLARLEGGR